MIAPRQTFKKTALSSLLSSAVLFPSLATVGLTAGMSIAHAADGLLDGTQTTWSSDRAYDGTLTIGRDLPNSALIIDSGATVVSKGGFIGRYNGSTGDVVVRGPGSEWIIPRTNFVLENSLYIGGAYDATLGGGKGSLRIEDGGKVSVKNTNITYGRTASGSLVVTGAGSVLDTENLALAGGNNGVFRIENGGSVLTTYANINNPMVITGTGSTWTSTGTIEATADLRIENAANVTSSIVLLGASGAQTSSQLTGAGSSLTTTRYLVVGDSTSSKANLSVADGATLSAKEGILIGRGSAVAEGFGNLTIGGDVDVSSWTLVPSPLAAAAAGTIDPATNITFGTGRSHLNFNHTNTGYVFANTLLEEGRINQFAGETTLTGNADRFSGDVAVSGGKLTLASNMSQVNTEPSNSINYSYTRFVVNGGTLIANAEAGRMQTDFLGNTYYTNRNEVTGTGVLGGSGRLGYTQVRDGGTISPGDNGIGTLNIQGDLDILNGGNYAVDIAGNGASDKIAVTGKTRLDGSTTVAVTALDPQQSYQNGQTYSILSSAGGITGTFAQAVSKSAFLDVSLAHNPNDVVLSIAQKDVGGTPGNPGTPENPGNPGNPGTPENPGNPGSPGTPTNPGTPGTGGSATPGIFQTVAASSNQWNTAGALGTLAQSGASLALYNNVLVLSADEARSAFNQLSGEQHAATRGALISSTQLVSNAVNDRMRAMFDNDGTPVPAMARSLVAAPAPARNGAWAQTFGTWSRTQGDDNTGKLSNNTGGFLIGADHAFNPNVRAGAYAGYSRSSFDVDSRRSSGDSDNYHLGIYGAGKMNAFTLRGGLGYTWHDVETKRSVAFGGFSDSLKADYDARAFQAFADLGYRIDAGRAAFEPFANVAYVRQRSDSFTENGGAAALRADSDTMSTTFSTLGLRASTALPWSRVDAVLRGSVGWRHAYGDTLPSARMAFATGDSFSTVGAPIAKNAAVLEAGMDFKVGRATTIGVGYQGQYGSDTRANSVNARVNVLF